MNPQPAWHVLATEQVFAHLNAGPAGLTSAEAARRLAEHGPNELRAAGRVSPWAVLLSQFKNVLIMILLVATALSAVLGHGVEAIAITVIVLFAVLLGFVQEYRAERAIEALRRMAALTATVLRDGEEVEIPARDLAPGDVILLRAGDVVPADARLAEAVNLQIEEAALTGESVPVEKHTAPLANGQLALGDRKNLVYSGTVATYGRGLAVVTATGMNTEFGKITGMLQTVETGKTPLQENLDRMGKMLAKAALVIVVVHRRPGVAARPALHRDVYLRHRAGRRRRPGGAAGRGDHLAGPRRPTHGQAECPGAPPAGRRSPGQHHGDLLGQDRHVDPG